MENNKEKEFNQGEVQLQVAKASADDQVA